MSYTKYDLEMLCSDIKSVLTTNLNTKISAINTEKNDSISLATVNSSAYFFQEVNTKEAIFNPFILYAIEDIETIPSIAGSSMNVKMSIVLVIADNGLDAGPNNINRLLRYQRAIREVLEENFQLDTNGIKIEVQSFVPVSFEGLNSSETSRAIGVVVTAIFA